MQLVTPTWLFERGLLHDARVLDVRYGESTVEISLDDEWANERGCNLAVDEVAPGTLIISLADNFEGERSLTGLTGCAMHESVAGQRSLCTVTMAISGGARKRTGSMETPRPEVT